MIKDYGIALAKLLFAGAWVDGELSQDEVRAIESFLDTIPGFTEEDYKRIYLYSEFPMSEDESRKVAEQFVTIIRTEEEKDLALLHLDALVKADRIVTPEERCFYVEIVTFLQQTSISPFGRFSKLFKNRNKWKPSETINGQDRETLWLDHYINNPVYFRLRVSYMGYGLPDDLSESTFEQACLHASLMVCIEMAEGSYRPDMIADYLEKTFGCVPEVAAYLVDLSALDYHHSRLNLSRQTLQVLKACDATEIETIFSRIVEIFKNNSTPEPKKHARLTELGNALNIAPATIEKLLNSLLSKI